MWNGIISLIIFVNGNDNDNKNNILIMLIKFSNLVLKLNQAGIQANVFQEENEKMN